MTAISAARRKVLDAVPTTPVRSPPAEAKTPEELAAHVAETVSVFRQDAGKASLPDFQTEDEVVYGIVLLALRRMAELASAQQDEYLKMKWRW